MPFTAAAIASAYGITANYWKIGQLYIDYSTNTGFVNYLGFDSEVSAFTTKTPIKTLEIRLSGSDITGIYGDTISSSKLSVTGSNVINFYDKIISSPAKATILINKTQVNYPLTEYTTAELAPG
jgi:hypothetical protein